MGIPSCCRIWWRSEEDCGDREQELLGRYDENQYLARMMKLAGHKKTYLYELDGHDHVAMVEPSFHILEAHIKQLLEENK